MILTDAAVKNRTTVVVLIILFIVAGAYSYITLPREAAPDVPIPIVLVSTTYEGVSPEDVESAVTMKIEKELTGLKGLKEVTSTSAEGLSMVVVEFLPGVVIDDALQYVRDRVDLAKPDLPDEADEPFIKEINVAEFPIMMISISGDISPVRLKAIADELEDAIEAVPGVLNVDVLGAPEREIRLELDPDRLASYDLTIPEIIQLIPSENVNISAGALETEGTKFNVRLRGEFEEPEEVDQLLLAVRDGKPIYLSDVTTVRDTFKDPSSFSRLDGKPSITVTVQKRIGANIVVIADVVKHILREAGKQAPMGVTFDITLDQSKYVRQMVRDLENNILSGLILVVGVLVVFMGWRTSAIVGLAIPMSMLMSFALISALGHTLNMVVLFGLLLSLGMLVDNAIVIVENIYRHMQLGHARFEAAILGAREVAWPIITSTATTVAAFFPLLFWPGIVGDFMKYLPITVIITLSSSLFVALVVSPTVSSCCARGTTHTSTRDHWFVGSYTRLLRAAIDLRYVTLALAVLVLALLFWLYHRAELGVQFFPDSDPDRALINIRSPQGTSIHESARLAREVERRIMAYRSEYDHLVTNVGSSSEDIGILTGMGSGPHVANLTLVFKDYEVRDRPSADIVAEIRDRLDDISGAEIKVEKEQHGPPTGAPVTVRIIGRDFQVLKTLSEKAKKMIATVPGLVNLRSDLEVTRPELAFQVDRRRAMLLGVNTALVGHFLKMAIFGREVGTYRQFNDEYDITVRLPLEKRVDIQDIFTLRVPNLRGQPVPLSSLGNFQYQGGFGTIHRINQKRVVTLTANNEGRLSSAVRADAQERLKNLKLPPGYQVRFAGEKDEEDKATAFLQKAFVIAILLIIMILVTQFNSLKVPFIIMSTVMLSMGGVLAGLVILRMPFGIIMTGIGAISLAGVVVNNAIVLLAYSRQLQAAGRNLLEAAIEAGRTRLRPVLLTATTTILGLVPMATGISFDFHTFQWVTRSQSSELWRSMAVAVIFGLSFATLLTLVVVPSLYVTLGGLRERDQARAGGQEAAAATSAE